MNVTDKKSVAATCRHWNAARKQPSLYDTIVISSSQGFFKTVFNWYEGGISYHPYKKLEINVGVDARWLTCHGYSVKFFFENLGETVMHLKMWETNERCEYGTIIFLFTQYIFYSPYIAFKIIAWDDAEYKQIGIDYRREGLAK